MTIRAGPVPHGGGRATAAAPDRSRADAVLAAVAIVVLMQLVAASVRGPADLRRFAWLQVAGVTLFSAVMLARGSVASDGRLSESAYYDANDLATLIVCSLPLALHLWRWSSPWARLALLPIVACLMVTLVKTQSRGGFLGFVAVALYLLVWFDGMSPVKRWGAVAVPVLLLVALGNGGYFERMQTLLNPSADYNWSGNSETGRMEVWKRGIGYMLDHPFLGVGAQAFGIAEGTLAPEAARLEEYGKGFKWSTAHNAFVEVGAEIGVFGLLLFVGLFVGAFRILARVRRGPLQEGALLARALTASLVGFAVTAFFLSQAYSAYFYTLLGMTLGLARLRDAAQDRRPGTLPWSRRPAANA